SSFSYTVVRCSTLSSPTVRRNRWSVWSPPRMVRIRHGLEVDATEPAEDQAVSDKVHRLAVAPVVEMRDHQQLEESLTGGGRPPVQGRAGCRPATSVSR